MSKIKTSTFDEVMARSKRNKQKRMKGKASHERIKLDVAYPTTIIDVEWNGDKVKIISKFWTTSEGVEKEITYDKEKQDFRIEEILEDADADCLEDMISRHFETQFVKNKKGYKQWEILGELDSDDIEDYLESLDNEHHAHNKNKRKKVNLLEDDEEYDDFEEDSDEE